MEWLETRQAAVVFITIIATTGLANIPLLIEDKARGWNWFALGFCLGIAYAWAALLAKCY
jgi:hypothetical protein